MVTWVLQEPGWTTVDRLLNHRAVDVVLPGPAITETIHRSRQRGNRGTPREILEAFQGYDARIVHPADDDLVRAAELLDGSSRAPGPRGESLSLGDALILAVVERLGWPILSRDRYWELLVADGQTTATVQEF
jgi:PIN domain nuclease of toxin-antitoxin system